MWPRQAAVKLADAAKKAMAVEWEMIEPQFEEQYREDIRALVWDHVRHILVGTKTAPYDPDEQIML